MKRCLLESVRPHQKPRCPSSVGFVDFLVIGRIGNVLYSVCAIRLYGYTPVSNLKINNSLFYVSHVNFGCAKLWHLTAASPACLHHAAGAYYSSLVLLAYSTGLAHSTYATMWAAWLLIGGLLPRAAYAIYEDQVSSPAFRRLCFFVYVVSLLYFAHYVSSWYGLEHLNLKR
jgi:hypothetical protein